MMRKPITAGSDRRSGIASVGCKGRPSPPKKIPRTASSSPAMKAARKRYSMNSAAEVRAEEGNGHRPGLTRGGEVGARLPILLAKESVPRTREGMVLVALAQGLHRGIGRRDRRTNARILTTVQAQHGDLHARPRRER